MTKRKLINTILLFENGEKESDRSLIIKSQHWKKKIEKDEEKMEKRIE